MQARKISTILTLLWVFSILLSACSPAAQQPTPESAATPEIAASPTSSPVETQDTGEPTPEPIKTEEPTPTSAPVDPTAACPVAGEGTTQIIDREQGFCLLYPSYFTIGGEYEPGVDILALNGPVIETERPMGEVPSVNLYVSLTGAAEGMDAAVYAGRYQEYYGQGLSSEPMSIGGQPAVVVQGIPTYAGGQDLFFIANGYRYHLWLTPELGRIPELEEHAQLVWKIVTESLVLFPPEAPPSFVTAEQVCPQATADSWLYTDKVYGMCALIPNEFEERPDMIGTGIFYGGAVLAQVADFGDVRTSIAFGPYGFFPTESPRQVLEMRMETILGETLQDTSIGGAPAVIFEDTAGPWKTRQALIISRGRGYTILVQPFEPEQWPSELNLLEKAWSTALSSMAFFDPWR